MKSTLHETDFLMWAEQQADAIRSQNLAALDTEGLLEELEGMSHSVKIALKSCLRSAMTNLLLLQFAGAHSPRAGWIDALSAARADIEMQLDDTPSVRRYIEALYVAAWSQARASAARALRQGGDDPAVLPPTCPYTLEQVWDFDYLPERA